jgi:hypothetical protein
VLPRQHSLPLVVHNKELTQRRLLRPHVITLPMKTTSMAGGVIVIMTVVVATLIVVEAAATTTPLLQIGAPSPPWGGTWCAP